MKVRVFNDFYDFANDTEPLILENVLGFKQSQAQGWVIQMDYGNLCLPATVVLDIITKEE